MKYTCDDGNAAIDIEADTPEDAAQQYVDGGDWGEITETIWVEVLVTPLDADGEPIEDDKETVTIAIDPDEPAECAHDWQSPHEIVGGIESNPGVWGNGGGVKITEVCANCGWYRVTDTWAQRSDTGQQGLESVEYLEPDDRSLEWIA